MPEMDGFTCTREISKLLPGVPILMHTLYWSPRVAIEALKAGARKAILKSQSTAVIAAVMELLPPAKPRLLVILKPPAKENALVQPLTEHGPAAQNTESGDAALIAEAPIEAPEDSRDAQDDDQDQRERKIV